MFRITTEGAAEIKRAMSEIEKRQLPFATALALTRTAALVKADGKSKAVSPLPEPNPMMSWSCTGRTLNLRR